MSGAYILRRLTFVAINIWVVVTIVFFMFRLLPGDPTAVLTDPLASDEIRARQAEALGLNEPLLVQYWAYLSNLLQGNLGVSFIRRTPVSDIVSGAFINTMILVVATFVVAYVLGVLGGVFLAYTRGRVVERIGIAVVLFIRGAPTFWVGMILIMVFAVQLDWFPSGGMRGGDFTRSGIGLYFSLEMLRHMVLPVAAASIYALGLPLLLMRNTMLEIIDADFMELLKAKGLSKFARLYRHALRNAMMPMIAQSSQFIAWAIGGMVVVEVVFSWPGLGREIVNSLTGRDYPVAQGSFLLIAILVTALYFIADLIAVYIDPRTRRS